MRSNRGKFFIIGFVILFFPALAFSAISETVIVEGQITGFDKKTVTLLIGKNKRKTTLRVPKKTIPKRFKIQINNKVRVPVNGKELLKKIEREKRKKEKKKRKKKL